MKKSSLAQAAVFLTGFLLLFVGINYYYVHVLLRENILTRSWEQFVENKEDIQVLVLGDSHPKYGIDPAFIPHSFNAADSSASYFQDYYKLNYLLTTEGISPKVVLVPIDLNSFSGINRSDIGNDWFWDAMVGTNGLYTYYGAGGYVPSVLRRYFPVIGSGLSLVAQFHTQAPAVLEKGHQIDTTDYSLVPDAKKGDDRELAAAPLTGPTIDAFAKTYFMKLLDLARDRGITVVLIRYPFLPGRYHSLASDKDARAYYAAIDAMAAGREGVVDLDYHNLFSNDLSYFQDPTHLNQKGAEALTQRVKNDLKL